MTSFASAFSSTSHDENYSNNTNTSTDNHQQESNNFSSIDLDQQSTLPQHSSYVSLTDAATSRTDITNNSARIPTSSTQDFHSNAIIETSSVPSDKRLSIPDMSKLTASSAAAVAAVGPTIDKLKQWGRSTFKCTKQTIYEKLGKTTRTVDVELDNQIEV